MPSCDGAMLIGPLRLSAYSKAIAALKQPATHLRAGPDREVGTLLANRSKEGFRGIPAPTAALVDFEVADAVVVATVEVLRRRNACLLRRLGEGIEHLPAQALLLNAPFPARTMQRAEGRSLTARSFCGVESIVVL